MARIQELIDRQKAQNAERERAAEEQRAAAEAARPKRAGTPLEQLIEAAREARRNRWEKVQVILSGEVVDVEIGHTLNGDDWTDLIRAHPAKLAADGPYQYNRAEVARAYPADRIRLDGEHPDADTWASVFDLISEEDRTAVEAVLWWLHEGEPGQIVREANPHMAEAVAARGLTF